VFSVKIEGLDSLKLKIDDLHQRQIPYAASRAINEMAKRIEQSVYAELRKLDRPSPYTMRSMAIKRSTKANLTAIVGIKGSAPGLGYDAPGKGTPWERAIGHHFDGGSRKWKKFEGALMKVGVLPTGMAAVPPSDASWAVQLDQYGNIPPSMIRLLLSYFSAAQMTGGYVANMSDKRRTRLHGVGRSANGFKVVNGVMYFAVPRKSSKTHNLHPGIWAKRGTHGSNLAPVMLFVRRPSYQKRIDIQHIATVEQAGFQTVFDKEFADAIRTAK